MQNIMDIHILVTGEAGVGKTQLINTFLRSSELVICPVSVIMRDYVNVKVFNVFKEEAEPATCRLRVKNVFVTFHIQESLFCF